MKKEKLSDVIEKALVFNEKEKLFLSLQYSTISHVYNEMQFQGNNIKNLWFAHTISMRAFIQVGDLYENWLKEEGVKFISRNDEQGGVVYFLYFVNYPLSETLLNMSQNR